MPTLPTVSFTCRGDEIFTWSFEFETNGSNKGVGCWSYRKYDISDLESGVSSVVGGGEETGSVLSVLKLCSLNSIILEIVEFNSLN